MNQPTLSNALTCPWCGYPASAGPSAQTCGGCRRRFTLSAGPALDARIVAPPPHPAPMALRLRWSVVVTYQFAALEPQGVASGTLDPVVAITPISQTAIAYPDVVTIAVWRKIALPDAIAGILVPTPIALFCAYLAIATVAKAPGAAAVMAVIAVVFGLLAALLLRRGFVIGRRRARVVGRWATIDLPFDGNTTFYGELFRRCGMQAPPVP